MFSPPAGIDRGLQARFICGAPSLLFVLRIRNDGCEHILVLTPGFPLPDAGYHGEWVTTLAPVSVKKTFWVPLCSFALGLPGRQRCAGSLRGGVWRLRLQAECAFQVITSHSLHVRMFPESHSPRCLKERWFKMMRGVNSSGHVATATLQLPGGKGEKAGGCIAEVTLGLLKKGKLPRCPLQKAKMLPYKL